MRMLLHMGEEIPAYAETLALGVSDAVTWHMEPITQTLPLTRSPSTRATDPQSARAHGDGPQDVCRCARMRAGYRHRLRTVDRSQSTTRINTAPVVNSNRGFTTLAQDGEQPPDGPLAQLVESRTFNP